jgi:four helix bundle protein
MNQIEELDIYQIAGRLADSVWDLCSGWESFSKKTLGSQLCRAADSIPANIAEGFGRFFYKENLRFLYFARGSLEETRNWLLRARNRRLIKQGQFDELAQMAELLGKKLNAFINSIKPLADRPGKRQP